MIKHSGRVKSSIQFFIGLIVVLGVIFFAASSDHPSAASELKIDFLDVGQGDAAYIKSPSGGDILIDGGPDQKVLSELGEVMDFGDKEINLVILTHPHADHLTGLVEVLKRYKVDEIWESGVNYDSEIYKAWKNEISAQNILDKKVKYGDENIFGEMKITVLYPFSSIDGSKIDNINNASVVNRLEYKNFSALFLGDAETPVQLKLVNSKVFSTVVKIAHHGSKNGLLPELMDIVRPAIAIISVGEGNKFGHPSAETISYLKSKAIKYYRTDQNGRINISSDGNDYWVKSQR